uniref:Uncharacterized protein n=1 Tax=Trichogramma kaykai TaxID=54128 RepID=A0ABD2W190_9HYME
MDAAIYCRTSKYNPLEYRASEGYQYTFGGEFIHFVARSGYKDEPKVDENGKPLLHRNTALDYAGKADFLTHGVCVVQDLFKIYYMNYTNDVGYTHFHVACEFSIVEAVKRFLELGQDTDMIDHRGISPLQRALYFNRGEVAELLLRGGADPIGRSSVTSLQLIIFSSLNDGAFAERFLKITKEMNQLVEVNAKNKDGGLTTLESAVASLLPNVVDLLLDNGADLSSFVFPSESLIDKRISSRRRNGSKIVKLRLASGALGIVECFQKRGYELNHSCVLATMKLFAEYEWFDKSSALEQPWSDDEEFMSKAKEIMMKPNLSFYDLIQLQPEEAEKQLTPRDYFELGISRKLNWFRSETHEKACILRLSEIMSRKFFRRWVRDPMWELTGYRLPNLCCDMINEHLTNEDLYNIFLAAAGLGSRW